MVIKNRGLKHGITQLVKRVGPKSSRLAILIAAFAGIGVAIVALSYAASSTVSFETEAGSLQGCVNMANDTTASGGEMIQFGATGGCASLAGAKLPISYSLANLAGTARFVDDAGSDVTGTGSQATPFATIAKAYSVAAAGDPIVVRAGNYNESGIVIAQNKSVKIMAFPGETPIFNGAQAASGGWTNEGTNSYRTYTPQPVTNGSGITFTTGQNLTADGVGKFPDQAWVGTNQLQQVVLKSALSNGKFWVDTVNNRIYLTQADLAQGNVEVSNKDVFISVSAPNTSIEGLKITRYSNSANDYGVIKFMATADNSTLSNVEISETAFMAVTYLGDSDINTNSSIQNLTLTDANWMGISAQYTEGFSMTAVKITGINQFDEFTSSPQSGGLKTSRTRNTKVINSDISNNNSPGLWFDQSNLNVQVVSNRLVNNASSGVFFEISDNLYLINNYITATGSARAVKLAGASGLKLVNNTIIGGSDVVGIYVDARSIAGCADPAQPLCANSYSSDRDIYRPYPATMSWLPSIDLMINNIIAYPTGQGFCGAITPLCITGSNSGAVVALNQVLHGPNTALGIPQTSLDGNVYANGSSNIAITSQGRYSSTASFTQALAGTPVSIPGLDQNSRAGNTWVEVDGKPTSSLASVHAQATPIPNEPILNSYLPAGLRHYGVTYK